MSHFSEQKVRSRLMQRFIDESAKGESGRIDLKIRLQRPTFEKSDTGGKVETGRVTLDEQVFALMPLKRRQTVEAEFTLPNSGKDELTKVQYILIASNNVDAQRGDFFDWDGTQFLDRATYRVEYVAVRLLDRKLVGVNFHAARS